MELYHKILGNDSRQIIIIHGLLGASDNWTQIAKRLSESYTVHLLDMRNHGRSPHSDVMNYDVMSRDIIHYMDSKHIVAATIIGHSMGGKIAMTTAATFPERINKIVVVDIAPKNYHGGHEHILKAMQDIPLENFGKRDEVNEWLATRIHGEGIRQFIMKNLGRDDSNNFYWLCNLQAIVNNYSTLMTIPALSAFHGETYFLKGALSDYITVEDEELITQIFVHAQIISIPQAGHWVHADNPEGFLAVLKQIL